MSRLTNITCALSVLYGIAIGLEPFLICRPVAILWVPGVRGYCGNEFLSSIVHEIFGLLIDTSISTLPLVFLSRTEIRLGPKIRVGMLMSAGILCVHPKREICSRSSPTPKSRVTIITGPRTKALHLDSSSDLPYPKGYLGLVSAIGVQIHVINSCAPALSKCYVKQKRRIQALARSSANKMPPIKGEPIETKTVNPSLDAEDARDRSGGEGASTTSTLNNPVDIEDVAAVSEWNKSPTSDKIIKSETANLAVDVEDVRERSGGEGASTASTLNNPVDGKRVAAVADRNTTPPVTIETETADLTVDVEDCRGRSGGEDASTISSPITPVDSEDVAANADRVRAPAGTTA